MAWTGYEAIDNGVFGTYESTASALEIGFDGAVTAATAIRDGITGSFLNIAYDVVGMVSSPDFNAIVAPATDSVDAEATAAVATFSTNLELYEQMYLDAVEGPGGADDVLDDAVNSAADTFALTVDTAATTLFTDTQQAEFDFVVAEGVLREMLSTGIAAAESTYTASVESARATYQLIVDPATAVRDMAVDAAKNTFDTWVATNSATKSTTLDELRDTFLADIAGYEDTYDQALEAAELIATTAMQSLFSAYSTPVVAAYTNMTTTVEAADDVYTTSSEAALTAYETFVGAFWATPDPDPDPDIDTTPLRQAAKDFTVADANANVLHTTTITGAVQAFLITAELESLALDNGFITTGYGQEVTTITAENTLLLNALFGQDGYLKSVVDTIADYNIDHEKQHLATLQSIANADRSLITTEHSAAETLTKAMADAVKQFQYDAAADLETYRTSVSGEMVTFVESVAADMESYGNATSTAEGDWSKVSADAFKTWNDTVSAQEVTLQNSLAGERQMLVDAMVSASTDWFTVASTAAQPVPRRARWRPERCDCGKRMAQFSTNGFNGMGVTGHCGSRRMGHVYNAAGECVETRVRRDHERRP